LQEPRGRDRRVGRPGHVGEEDAVVRLVDAQLLLHRHRRQADLVADDPGAVGEPPPGLDQLDLVRVVGRQSVV
jgi:hypothetical protein